jgi:pentatricopeptide repeat protein
MLAFCVTVVGALVAMHSSGMVAAEKPVPDAELLAAARNGMPIVSAIYAYQHENGLWPHHLDDLPPRYISEAQLSGWSYNWFYFGKWSLFRWLRSSEVRVEYDYAMPAPSWVAEFYDSESEVDKPINLVQPMPTTLPANPGDVARNTEAELLRRTVIEPQQEDHWRSLISFYVRAGRFDDARGTYDHFAASLPTPPEWGPALLAYIDFKQGHVDGGERRLRKVADDVPSFPNHVYLFSYFQWTGQSGKAIAEVNTIAGLNTFSDVGNENPDAILYDAGEFAYHAKQYALVVKVADACERLEKQRGYCESSYYAMRACAHLALGEFDKALASCQEAIDRNSQRRLWAGDLDGLKAAILRKDSTYPYHGLDEYAEPIQALLDYQ